MVRIKQRYILAELVFEQKDLTAIELVNEKFLQTILKKHVQAQFGDLGYA